MSVKQEKVCLLCYRRTCETDDKMFQVKDETKTNNNLEGQILVVFLLRNVLEVPKEFCETLLTTKGNPSQWISCCPSCTKSVHDLHKMFLELTSIQKNYDLLRQEVKLILEGSRSVTGTGYDENASTSQIGSADDIRRFIFSEQKNNTPLEIPQNFIIHDNKEIIVPINEFLLIKEEIGEIEEVEEFSLRDDYFVEQKFVVEDSVSWSSVESDNFSCNADSVRGSGINDTEFRSRESSAPKSSQNEVPSASLDKKSKQKNRNCQFCGKFFQKPCDLRKHERTHTGEKPFACSECGRAFSDKGHLTQHMRIHTGEKAYQCFECGKLFAWKSNLNKHVKFHTEKESSASSVGFSSHLKPRTAEAIFNGENSGNTNSELENDTKSPALENKLQTFTNERPRNEKSLSKICSFCDKSFKKQSQLEDHERTHTGEKPFGCSECGKTFAKKSTLRIHRKIHTEKKPFRCTICEKTFTFKQHLDSHSRTHIGEKPYLCRTCGKRFSKLTSLKSHSRSHTQ